MSKETILEKQLEDLEEQKKEIEIKIRNAKIELRRLKAGKALKNIAFKYNNNWRKNDNRIS